MENTTQQKTKTREEIREEVRALSKKADDFSKKQLDLLPDFVSTEQEVSLETIKFNTADPEKSYTLFYTGEKLLKDHLPKGIQNKALRDFIREEKNIFLNRGKKKNKKGIRFSDSRQSYIDPFLEESINIILNWIKTGANPLDLYDLYRAANVKYGFDK